ncbi:MAG TPA: hypothetical protein VKB80_35765 [Kofleriaceae bacterium]|nr:hypothetical protein [Kofleriaceae bacterium]
MRITITLLALSSTALIWACGSSTNSSTEGVRADGTHVTCEEGRADGMQTCTPDDGDDECESWDEGGSAGVLWPPNHKLVRLTLDDCAAARDCDDGGDDGADDAGDDAGDVSDDAGDDGSDDAGDDGSDDGGDVGVAASSQTPRRSLRDAVPVAITSITADEPVEVGAGGDGHTTDFDMAIVDDVTFDLRSERQGGGDGRVYWVNYIDSDGVDQSCEFMVPHDRGPFGGAVDSGVAVTLTP